MESGLLDIMDKHEKFTAWSVERGVIIDGISAYRFEGRGIGIRAEKDISTDQVILQIPASALRHAKTVPQSISRPLGKITIHGLLATDLALDKSSIRQPWRDVLPTASDFAETHPMCWDSALQALLPPASHALLQNQFHKFHLDWSAASKAFPEISRKDYHYAWLIVNTRTFYWLFPNAKKKLATDDCMALSPFADYFNHAAVGCHVNFGASGFKIKSNRNYVKGEEVYISYGSHSNDFLLAEYGFIMSENEFDRISLDKPVFDLLSDSQKEKLRDAGFLGGYLLDKDGVCYRTQVALRIGVVSENRWRRFVDGEDGGGKDQVKVDGVLTGLVRAYHAEALKMVEKVRSEKAGLASQRTTLEGRWKQIIRLLDAQLE